MAKAKLYKQDGKEAGTHELPATLFDCEVNKPILHQAVVAHLANQRQGTASTKGRSDVKGGGRKPYRQKGTGRARAGTRRSPIWRGGGVVFGPHPREYRQSLPKKMKRQALRSALSGRARDGDILVVESLQYEEPKTKVFADFLKSVDSEAKKVLLVLDKPDTAVIKSARNVPGVKIMLGNMLNAYDVLWAEKIIMTQGAIQRMEEVFAT